MAFNWPDIYYNNFTDPKFKAILEEYSKDGFNEYERNSLLDYLELLTKSPETSFTGTSPTQVGIGYDISGGESPVFNDLNNMFTVGPADNAPDSMDNAALVSFGELPYIPPEPGGKLPTYVPTPGSPFPLSYEPQPDGFTAYPDLPDLRVFNQVRVPSPTSGLGGVGGEQAVMGTEVPIPGRVQPAAPYGASYESPISYQGPSLPTFDSTSFNTSSTELPSSLSSSYDSGLLEDILFQQFLKNREFQGVI